MRNMYGWDKLRTTGLKELKRLIGVAEAEGKKHIVRALKLYYPFYVKKKEDQLYYAHLETLDPKATRKDSENKDYDAKQYCETLRNNILALEGWLNNHYEIDGGKKVRHRIRLIRRERVIPLLSVEDITLKTEESPLKGPQAPSKVDNTSGNIDKSKLPASSEIDLSRKENQKSGKPRFVVKSVLFGSPQGDDRLVAQLREDGVLYVSIMNVGADITWVRLINESRPILSLESKPMPRGTITLLKLNYDKAISAIRVVDGDGETVCYKPIVFQIEYTMENGYTGIQTYHYGLRAWEDLELKE